MSGVNEMLLNSTDAGNKYVITKECREFNKRTVYRIKAIKDFGTVKTGSLGGWVESSKNLSQYGTCWVADNAIVCDDAVVSESAIVRNNAVVCALAIVSGETEVSKSAIVSGESCVSGTSKVSGDSQVYGKATVINASVDESSSVEDSAVVEDGAVVRGTALVAGTANVSGRVTIKGSALVYENAWIFEHIPEDGQSQLDTVIENSAEIGGNAVVSGATVGLTVIINDYMRVEGCTCLKAPVYRKGNNFSLTSVSKDLLSFTAIFQSRMGCTYTFKEWHDEYPSILGCYFQTFQIVGFEVLFNEMCDLTGNQNYKI